MDTAVTVLHILAVFTKKYDYKILLHLLHPENIVTEMALKGRLFCTNFSVLRPLDNSLQSNLLGCVIISCSSNQLWKRKINKHLLHEISFTLKHWPRDHSRPGKQPTRGQMVSRLLADLCIRLLTGILPPHFHGLKVCWFIIICNQCQCWYNYHTTIPLTVSEPDVEETVCDICELWSCQTVQSKLKSEW